MGRAGRRCLVSRTAWHRVPPPGPLRAAYPGTRAWQRDVEDGHLSVFVGREPVDLDNGDSRILWHLSISHRTCVWEAATCLWTCPDPRHRVEQLDLFGAAS